MSEEMSQEYKDATQSLLFQLADDDFMFAYRGSEWLGLAPHIEEDVASSSISQDSMGHAAMYYKLLEDFGVGNADLLAHLRPTSTRKNSVLTERANGKGTYMETPQYDWALQVVRSYFYISAKKIKVDSLCASSYVPLADIALKVKMEIFYHLLHWEIWFKQLLSSTDVAKKKMMHAILQVSDDFSDFFSYGIDKEIIEKHHLIETEEILKERWNKRLSPIFESLQIEKPNIPIIPKKNGRNGEHLKDLDEALKTLSEVYSIDPAASW
ncbi:1,2-phenylacetyl-CoA epoxidase subunit PaaC [Psychrobacillus sp. FSL K6-2684]|uniref:1,2-phenylacetyl-CoA epoxidase subunit PaaC n=1 Tax=unclassified Psychrobacillus TaxID=2636677 RepID=UPI001781E896|nr:1,2-phenylacetyl-CoA epoxidase subunit PaaC [Psychrobacillus sp. AK 1817]